MTSKDDFTTRRVYPLARFIGQNLSTEPSSITQTHKTIGHYEPYLSYEVIIADKDKLSEKSYCSSANGNWFAVPSRKLSSNAKDKQANKTCNETIYLYENKGVTNEAHRYKMTELTPLSDNSEKGLGYMWNIRIDESLLENGSAESVLRKGSHSANVRTTLGRMLDDMLFTPPEKPLD